MENLLGEIEKLSWIQWRMNYPTEYNTLINIANGREGTQNILSQMRWVLSSEDPTQGSTVIQDEAYRDLEKLHCDNVKNIDKDLVVELAQQPKLVEQEALRISSDLTKKLDRAEALLVKLERWTTS